LENFVAPKGEWADLPGGIGARSYSSVHFDSKGILWIFGGSTDFMYSYLNAGWNYDLAADKYRWVVGSDQESSQLPQFLGTMGVESPDVFPGLIEAQASVIDSKDQIWIYASHNLFRWNTTSGNFAWIGGKMIADTGTPGQPSADVWPGVNYNPCTVLDSQDNIWLVGGFTEKSLNTVWQYNTTSGYWTFVYGSPETFVENNYTENVFGSRTQFACEIDENDLIWVYGGYTESGYLFWGIGDLWTFDPKTWNWSVIHNDTLDSYQVIEVRDEFSEKNRPGSRYNHRMINRLDGTLMMLGGYQFNTESYFDDIWIFDMTLKQWKIIYGGITPNAPTERTNYRAFGSVLGFRHVCGVATGKTNKGQFVLYGGGDGYRQKDIWIVPQDVCALDMAGCHPQANCSMDQWLVVCTCQEGLVGDGKTCELPVPIDPPVADTPVTPVTSNTPSKKTSGTARNTSALGLLISFFYVTLF
jgi:hypothetical protein